MAPADVIAFPVCKPSEEKQWSAGRLSEPISYWHELLLSAVTVGEIQAGIELTREQDIAKAEELEAWLRAVLVSYSVLPMNADTFREWARITHRRSDTCWRMP